MTYVWIYNLILAIILFMMLSPNAHAETTCYRPLTWQKVGDHYELRDNPDQNKYVWPRCGADDVVTEVKP